MLIYKAAAVATLALLCASCGKEDENRVAIFPVKGQVTVKGQPAENAEVGFYPVNSEQRLFPHGRVQADGSFQVSTYELNDGAPAGEYVVTIVWRDPPPPGSAADAPEGPDHLKGRYANYKTSPLRAVVQEGETELPPFTLD